MDRPIGTRRTSKTIDGEDVVEDWRGRPLGWCVPEHKSFAETVAAYQANLQSDAEPTRCRLETDSAKRKEYPIYSGVIRYFPDALAAVAMLSKVGNDKHNPGQPLHWARSKSTDELDCLVRHLAEAGTKDTDGIFHDVKVAWRALANLQKLLERERGLPISPGSKE